MEQDYEQMKVKELRKIYGRNHETLNNYTHKNLCQIPLRKTQLIRTIKFQERLLDFIDLKNGLNKLLEGKAA
jgi:hypothetical protein